MSSDRPNNELNATLFVGDSRDPILTLATSRALDIFKAMAPSTFAPPKTQQRGGTASKMLAVSETPYSMAILHFQTCLWDTCACEALVHARGGKVTDLFGRPLVHGPDSNVINIFGVVISSGEPIMSDIHSRLCSEMLQDHAAMSTIKTPGRSNVL